MFYLQDSGGNLWAVSVTDGGIITRTPAGAGSTPNINLNDVGGSTSYQLTVTTGGIIGTLGITFNAAYAKAMQLLSPSGFAFNLIITIVAGNGILDTVRTTPLTYAGVQQQSPQVNRRSTRLVY